jgi:hypothetical protein
MLFFLGFLTLIAIYIAMKQFNSLTNVQKLFIFIAILVLFVVFIFIEMENEKYRNEVIGLKIQFNGGKTIICNDYNISKNDFTITSNSFLAKKGHSHYGLIVPFTQCFQGK